MQECVVGSCSAWASTERPPWAASVHFGCAAVRAQVRKACHWETTLRHPGLLTLSHLQKAAAISPLTASRFMKGSNTPRKASCPQKGFFFLTAHALHMLWAVPRIYTSARGVVRSLGLFLHKKTILYHFRNPVLYLPPHSSGGKSSPCGITPFMQLIWPPKHAYSIRYTLQAKAPLVLCLQATQKHDFTLFSS